MDIYNKSGAPEYAQIPISEKMITAELSEDFTLPDYQPEIKRLLRIGACVLPPSKYVGDTRAEFAGNVDYYVLYTASDNGIYCAPLTGEYKIDVPVERGAEWSAINLVGGADVQADMISGRVTSPRKLNVKCRLKARARILGDVATGREYDGEQSNETLRKIADATRVIFGTDEMQRLSDEMILDSRDGEVRVICADGRAMMSEVICQDGEVTCRGDVYLKIMMAREGDGRPYTAQRKLPFSHSVGVNGVNSRCQASAKAVVCEMNLDVEDNRILIDLGMMTDVTVHKPERINYVKDVYSTVYKTDCTYKTLGLPGNNAALSSNFTLSDSVSLEEAGISQDCSVIDSWGVAVTDNIQCDADGRMTATGRARFTLLLDRGGEYSCSDIEMPFKYSADTGVCGEDAWGAVTASVVLSRARIDGERVGVDAEISVSGCVFDQSEISMLDSISFGDEIDKARGEYVVCYPSRQDSLWSVAKRYGATVSELARNNRISDGAPFDHTDSLTGVNYLVI